MFRIFVRKIDVFSTIDSKDQVGQPTPLLQEHRLINRIPKNENLATFLIDLRVMI